MTTVVLSPAQVLKKKYLVVMVLAQFNGGLMKLLEDFSEEVILEMCQGKCGSDGVEYLSGRIVDTSRWSYQEEHLVTYLGETYSISFDVAATECQECDQELHVSKLCLASLIYRVKSLAIDLGLTIRTLEIEEQS